MIKQPNTFIYGHEGLNIMYKYPKYYKDALRATLEHLKPHVCLEIGTSHFGSTQVFQDYFEANSRPDNIVVTCDIITWTTKPENLTHAHFVQVYPHFHDQYMVDNHSRMISDWTHHIRNSITTNRFLIEHITNKQIDFAFIDADHRAISLSKDLEMCHQMNIPYILLEDVAKEEMIQESATYYHEIVKRSNLYDCYDFDDWTVHTNCALLKRRV